MKREALINVIKHFRTVPLAFMAASAATRTLVELHRTDSRACCIAGLSIKLYQISGQEAVDHEAFSCRDGAESCQMNVLPACVKIRDHTHDASSCCHCSFHRVVTLNDSTSVSRAVVQPPPCSSSSSACTAVSRAVCQQLAVSLWWICGGSGDKLLPRPAVLCLKVNKINVEQRLQEKVESENNNNNKHRQSGPHYYYCRQPNDCVDSDVYSGQQQLEQHGSTSSSLIDTLACMPAPSVHAVQFSDCCGVHLRCISEALRSLSLKHCGTINLLDHDSWSSSTSAACVEAHRYANVTYLEIIRTIVFNFSKLSCIFQGLRELHCEGKFLFFAEMTDWGTAIGNLRHLYSLTLRDTNLVNIDFLSRSCCQHLRRKLVYLNISDNVRIADYGPLAALTHLRVLHMSNTSVACLKFLSFLTNLEELDISGCHAVDDTSPIADVAKLRVLLADNCRFVSIQFLQHTRCVEVLSLRGCQFVLHFSPLKFLVCLHTVHLSNTSISDISMLSSSTAEMQCISLDGCSQLSDVSHLEDHVLSLRTLQLSGTRITSLSFFLNGFSTHVRARRYCCCCSCTGTSSLFIERLDLTNCQQLTDYRALGLLLHLKWLTIDGSSVNTLGWIEELSDGIKNNSNNNNNSDSNKNNSIRLVHFSLSRTPATLAPFSAIGLLLNVSVLDLSYTTVSDIDWISNCTSLRYLDLAHCDRVLTFDGIASLYNLKELSLECTRISDISWFGDGDGGKSNQLDGNSSPMDNLEKLTLYGCVFLKDFSPIKYLQNIRWLSLCDTHVSDTSWMKECRYLEEIHFPHHLSEYKRYMNMNGYL